jgi:hypothetical protein
MHTAKIKTSCKFDEIIVLKRILPICFLYCLKTSVSFSQSGYFQQQADYKIQVSLNDSARTLDGFEAIRYTNHSPDTLHYIWFHLWPNAYKNDRTALSEQLLRLGRTDFYFSDEKKRGYINRLDFKVDGTTAVLEDHPLYIDIARLILPSPLMPGQTIEISTPFHEKIPYNFSRGGHVGNAYQITQWYPKPAVYDSRGWHPIPYLDQGEFYSEFGNFQVQITVPADYVVAATGELQNPEEIKWLKEKAAENTRPVRSIAKRVIRPTAPVKKGKPVKGSKTIHKNMPALKPAALSPPPHSTETKTLTFIQDHVHDFAWFADRRFIVNQDTLRLPSGKIIHVNAYYSPEGKKIWEKSIGYMKDAIETRSRWLGEYPYGTVSAVEAKMGFDGGMEYPTITSISPMADAKSLDMTIEHEVGHNWNYGILASNEREYPWMDEGINTYFDNRYEQLKYPVRQEKKQDFMEKRLPRDYEDLTYRILITGKTDQPIETPSENFSSANYNAIVYHKTGLWMKQLEDRIGKELFDSCLHEYYNRWKFKHPYPEDFKKVVEDVSKKKVDSFFSLLSVKGGIAPPEKKTFKVASFFSFKNTDRYHYLFLLPAAGYNDYDQFMIGGAIHNYTLPEPAFHFFAVPMYATGSGAFTILARAGYHIMSYGAIRKTEISVSAEKYTMNEFTDSTGRKNYMGFSKIVPSVKLTFRNKNATSSMKKWIAWKTYFIKETNLSFSRDSARAEDVISYPSVSRYLNQLTLVMENDRALYPWSANLVAEQGKEFLRLALEGKYFFNYPKKGGLQVRLFAGKFIYLTPKTLNAQFETDRYHLNMTGANGYEDYTYSNYFAGRNEFQKFPSQQIMIRDGGFKVRSDLLSEKIGKTDDWLASVNLATDFPENFNPLQVLPVKIPLKIFLDAGTYAGAWDKNAPSGKFIYDAGLQISLFKDLVNVYVPLLYSKIYSDYFKSIITEKRFWRNISFSIDIQNFRPGKFFNL